MHGTSSKIPQTSVTSAIAFRKLLTLMRVFCGMNIKCPLEALAFEHMPLLGAVWEVTEPL